VKNKFNSRVFADTIKTINKNYVYSIGLGSIEKYPGFLQKAKVVLAEQYETVYASISRIADAIMDRYSISRRYTVVIEFILFKMFLEATIDELQPGETSGVQSEKIARGNGVPGSSLCWQ
jgi:hypothetical protein